MLRLLVNWLLSTFALILVANLVPGFRLSGGLRYALLAAAVIGLINATIGAFLKIITFPLTVLTLGVFWFVVNAIVLELASMFLRGFEIRSFFAAFVGAVALSFVNMVLHWMIPKPRRQAD